MSTTTGPVTYPLAAEDIKLGMTVHYEDDVYQVAGADAAELTGDLVSIQYTDGVSITCDRGLQLDVVVHAAMPDSGGYWAILYRSQRKQVDQLLVELDQHAAAALANAGHPPEVRAAHAFEANHLAAAVRSVFGLD